MRLRYAASHVHAHRVLFDEASRSCGRFRARAVVLASPS
jgi:hypothetical protein